ncbi:DUF3426 domain-containing protein [Microbulbifer taiwanensis]|uniref:DUF3426 domain-containing protein n=1 Tax=Microbulbifer taiwanensis TaxID=986746 RepID=A0ABW1YSQ5_9GAMM|nr:DUF3426 domain-containing protein [Microbulbifer taiwanensis]
MSQLVTRCPHCSTSFHVNEQQLRAARGAVRCGSCLQVFRADENIVFAESDPAASRDLEALLEDDDFLIHDDIDLEDDQEKGPELAPPTVPAAKETDEKIAGEPAEDQPLIGEAFGDSHWQDIAASPAVEDTDNDEDLGPALKPDRDDDPWANESPEPPQKRESSLSTRWEQSSRTEEFSERLEQMEAHSARPRTSDSETFSVDPSREQLINAIEPAPLEVAWKPRRDRRLPGWLWGLLALLLLVGIAAQLAYFRFDSLSKQQPWRDLYASICPLLDCQLPPLEDLRAIRTSNLVVRSHPQLAGALVVDAVLLNTAPFAQPFPSLLLNFSDLKDKPVASRRFTPREYLQGELAGRKQMPSGSPVHIALEIVDPGSEAVNYELHIAR